MHSTQAASLVELGVLSVPQAADQVLWNPDGVHLAVLTPRGSMTYYYDTKKNQIDWTIQKFGSEAKSYFSPSGRYFISSPILHDPIDNTEALTLFDTLHGSPAQHIRANPPDEEAVTNFAQALAVSSKGDRAAVALGSQSGRVAIYDTSDWSVVQYLVVRRPTSGAKIIIDSQRHIIALLYVSGLIQTWDYSDNTLLKEFNVPVGVAGELLFNPLAGTVMVAGTGAIMSQRVAPGEGQDAFVTLADDPSALVTSWDPLTGQKTGALVGPGEGVRGLAISPDGKYVAATTAMPRSPSAKLLVWDASTGKLIAQEGFATRAQGVDFSPDGTKLAVSVGREIRIVSVAH